MGRRYSGKPVLAVVLVPGTGLQHLRLPNVNYRIEYLTETTEQDTVCHTLLAHSANLDAAAAEAFEKADMAKHLFGATGFQIRHMNAVDKIVVIADFDDDDDPG